MSTGDHRANGQAGGPVAGQRDVDGRPQRKQEDHVN